MKDINQRGVLTDALAKKYQIDTKKLRLLPYLQHCLMNSFPIDPMKIDSEERQILQDWRDKGFITFSMTEPCTCTKEFWNKMCEILYETYVLEK